VCGECIPLFFQVRRNKKLLLVLTSCARRLFPSVITTF
jgi:hypothetical protein